MTEKQLLKRFDVERKYGQRKKQRKTSTIKNGGELNSGKEPGLDVDVTCRRRRHLRVRRRRSTSWTSASGLSSRTFPSAFSVCDCNEK